MKLPKSIVHKRAETFLFGGASGATLRERHLVRNWVRLR